MDAPKLKQGLGVRVINALTEHNKLDRLLHPSLQHHANPMTLVRAKLLSLTCWSCILISPLVAAPYIQLDRIPLAMMTIGFGLIACLGGVFIRFFGKMSWATTTLCAAFFGANVSGFMVAGGSSSPASYWFALVPMMALFFNGVRHGMIWFITCLIAFIGLIAGERLGLLQVTTIFEGDLLVQYRFNVGLSFLLIAWVVTISTEALRTVLINAAKQEKQRFQSVLEAAKDAIIIFDDQKKIAMANQSAQETFPNIERVIPLIRETDEWIEIDDRAYSISMTSLDDERFHQIAVLRDETERYQVAMEMERARDEANTASAAKSQFLANMSHELRTPLNAIIGYSEMIQEDLDDDGQSEQPWYEDIRKVNQAGNHLLALISGVLDLSKIEAGRMLLHEEDVNIHELFEELAETCKPLIHANDNTLDVQLAPDVQTLHTDRVKIQQILLNLLSNAAKFTHDGVITLSAILAGDDLVITVHDTGIGIDEANQASVFDAFTQVDGSSTREYGGTGLGLTLVHELTVLLGGDVRLESKQGEGSSFIVTLPLSRVDM